LLAHCARALRGQPAPIDWQRAFGDLGALCSEALVALHDDALAGLALPKLDLLLQLAPKSTANRLLRARALAATGRATEAAELHAEHSGGMSRCFLRGLRERNATRRGSAGCPSLHSSLHLLRGCPQHAIYVRGLESNLQGAAVDTLRDVSSDRCCIQPAEQVRVGATRGHIWRW
jgi:hypothetical protein